jgi:hypothetical protein
VFTRYFFTYWRASAFATHMRMIRLVTYGTDSWPSYGVEVDKV